MMTVDDVVCVVAVSWSTHNDKKDASRSLQFKRETREQERQERQKRPEREIVEETGREKKPSVIKSLKNTGGFSDDKKFMRYDGRWHQTQSRGQHFFGWKN